MAPQVTVYFHKLPAIARGASGCRMTFTLGRLSVKLEVPNDEHIGMSEISALSHNFERERERESIFTFLMKK